MSVLDWTIKYKQGNNDFWAYVKDHSNKIGLMGPLERKEITQLLNISNKTYQANLDSAITTLNLRLKTNVEVLLNQIFI